jgi:hypothetical protein
MPDLDVVERNLSGPWRGAYRLVKGKQPFQALHDALIRALAAQLRMEGGIPALAETSEAVARAASREGTARSLAELSRNLERRFGFSASAKGTAAAHPRVATGTTSSRIPHRFLKKSFSR